MINAQILALRERKKHEKEFKKRSQSSSQRRIAASKKVQPFSGIACGIAPIEHSTDWAMKYTTQQDNASRRNLTANSLNTSLKRSKVYL
tara:strand:+ start:2567 stop:2833 length:267 start_codon:yes stop_codon:yes gene_type:complete